MKTRKKVSHWYERGEAYAKGIIVIANSNLPPHAVDFYLGALSVVKSSPKHPLKDNTRHPFWALLEDLVEDGKITPKQLGIVSQPADLVEANPDSGITVDEELELVTVASGHHPQLLKPLAILCHSPHPQLGMPAPRFVLNALALC